MVQQRFSFSPILMNYKLNLVVDFCLILFSPLINSIKSYLGLTNLELVHCVFGGGKGPTCGKRKRENPTCEMGHL